MKVMLVFDTAYGADPRAELGDAFWLVESPDNRALALKAWQSGSTDSNSAVFDLPPGPPMAADVVGRVQDIELHHTDWTEIAVVGVKPTPQLHAAMAEAGYKPSERSPGWISIQR